MSYRRCLYRSAEREALEAQGFCTVAVNAAGVALLVRVDDAPTLIEVE